MVPLHYSPEALRDLDEIADYIRIESPERAARLFGVMDTSLKRLCLFPESGMLPREEALKELGYRISLVGVYLVFYRFEKKRLNIIRVIHGRRDYPFLI